MFFTFLVLCLVGTAFAQVARSGQCPLVEFKPDFNISKYLGRWYEHARTFIPWELNGECVHIDYTAGGNGIIKVVTTQLSALTREVTSTNGNARTPDASDPSKLKVEFPSVLFATEFDYWVLDTDYETFSVAFSCSKRNSFTLQYGWILTRTRYPAASVLAKIDEVLTNSEIEKIFSRTKHENCTTD